MGKKINVNNIVTLGMTPKCIFGDIIIFQESSNSKLLTGEIKFDKNFGIAIFIGNDRYILERAIIKKIKRDGNTLYLS